MEKILSSSDVTMNTCNTVAFNCTLNNYARFDDIGHGLFLHLDDGSECIDWGDPFMAAPKRDFDDQIGPIDVEGVGYDLPEDPEDPDYKPYDIGADEYPTQDPCELVYWWERFLPPSCE